jgi:hypothetical protein
MIERVRGEPRPGGEPSGEMIERVRGEPRPGGDRQIAGLLAITLFAYYLLTLGGHQYSSDGIIIFQSAKQLLFQHSLVLAPPVRWDTDVRVSIYGIGMTLAYIPGLAIWWPLFERWPGLKAVPYDPSLVHNPALYANLPYLLCSVLNPIVTAATGVLVFRMARRLGLSAAWSLVAAATYGLASPAAAYARYDFSQPLAGLALTAATWGLLAAQRGATLRPLVVSGTYLGCGLLTRPEVLAMVPWAGAWIWLRNRNQDARALTIRIAALLAPVAVAAAGYVWISGLKFGAIGNLGYAPPTTQFTGLPAPIFEGLAGLLISPARGLLVFFPLSVLAVPGLWRLNKRHPGAASLFAGFLGVALLVYGSFVSWWGGWCWGPRYLAPLLPIVTLAATAWVALTDAPARRAREVSFVLLALLGFVISWNGILFDFVEHHRWLAQTIGSVNTGRGQFRLAASPLVTGWFNPLTHSLDLFWLRLLHRDQVQAYGDLLGPARSWMSDSVTTYASLAGAMVPLLLLAVLLATVYRLRTLTRRPGPAKDARGILV